MPLGREWGKYALYASKNDDDPQPVSDYHFESVLVIVFSITMVSNEYTGI